MRRVSSQRDNEWSVSPAEAADIACVGDGHVYCVGSGFDLVHCPGRTWS